MVSKNNTRRNFIYAIFTSVCTNKLPFPSTIFILGMQIEVKQIRTQYTSLQNKQLPRIGTTVRSMLFTPHVKGKD